MNRPIKIAIVDDHKMLLEGLSLMLGNEPEIEVPRTFINGKLLLEALENEEHFDVILLDINMPELNGIEICKLVKKKYPIIKIIALSMVGENNLIKLMLKNGANGYLHKNAGMDEIREAIFCVMENKTFLSKEISEHMYQKSDSGVVKITNSPFPKLSRREEEILEMIIDEQTTHDIAEKLFISFGTVESHRRNIMIKLGAKNTAGMVRTALEYGLIKK